MTTQKDKSKCLLKELEKFGFHPTDVKHGNGYFIFDHGKDMVVHFHIKELKGWLFGIWWDMEDKNKLEFFTQYEKNIDKFKPSASCFVVSLPYKKKEIHADLEWRVIPILKFIRDYRYVAWCYDGGYPLDCWEYKTPWQARKEYYKYAFKYYWRIPRIEKRFGKKFARLAKKISKGRLIDYAVIDKNVDGWVCYPRYEVVCKGFVDEEVKPGCYRMDFSEEDINKRLLKKIARYDKKAKKARKKGASDVDSFNGGLHVWVKK